MIGALIGGAIAAVIGAAGYAIVGLWLELRREKAQRLTMVDALITEIEENLKKCKSPAIRKMWWFAPYKFEAYHAYKSRLFFLSEDVRGRLAHVVVTLEGVNIGIQMHLSRAGSGKQAVSKPLQIPEGLIKDLEFVKEELRKWRGKHTH